jgi:hypothetical protein
MDIETKKWCKITIPILIRQGLCQGSESKRWFLYAGIVDFSFLAGQKRRIIGWDGYKNCPSCVQNFPITEFGIQGAEFFNHSWMVLSSEVVLFCNNEKMSMSSFFRGKSWPLPLVAMRLFSSRVPGLGSGAPNGKAKQNRSIQLEYRARPEGKKKGDPVSLFISRLEYCCYEWVLTNSCLLCAIVRAKSYSSTV